MSISPSDDPVLLRSAADAQMTAQITKENELLKAALSWQDKSEAFEKEIFGKVNALWKTYEAAHSNMLLENQQRSVFLSANVDSTEPQAEWAHFASLNHLIPADTQPKTLDSVLYPHKDDPLTIPIKEGILDRQKKFIRTWQTGAYWVLTPSGNLHSYHDSSAPLAKPNLSIPLSACSLGPLPSPEADAKGKTAEPCFTLETPDGKQVLRAKSWEELDSWHNQLEKFTQKTELPPLPPHELEEHSGDLGVASPTQEEDVSCIRGLPSPFCSARLTNVLLLVPAPLGHPAAGSPSRASGAPSPRRLGPSRRGRVAHRRDCRGAHQPVGSLDQPCDPRRARRREFREPVNPDGGARGAGRARARVCVGQRRRVGCGHARAGGGGRHWYLAPRLDGVIGHAGEAGLAVQFWLPLDLTYDE